MKRKKALILGVTGTLGGALAHNLLGHGWEVHGAARFSGGQQPEDWEKRGICPTVFETEEGGLEDSNYADPGRMSQQFGEPEIALDTVIDRAVATVARS